MRKKLANFFCGLLPSRLALSTENFLTWADACFVLFLATFTLPIRKILFDQNSFATVVFSESLTVFLEISEIFLALALLLFGVFTFLKNKKIPPSSARPIFLFAIFSLASAQIALIFAQDFRLGVFGIFKLVEIFAVAFFIFARKFPLQKVAKILLAVALFQGALGLIQFSTGHSVGLEFLGEQSFCADCVGSPKVTLGEQSFLRATGTFLHPNVFACFLLFTFFTVQATLCTRWQKILVHILLVPVLLSFSRAGILGIFLGFFFLPGATGRLNFSDNLKRVFVPILIFIILLWAMPLWREVLFSRLAVSDSILHRLKLLQVSQQFAVQFPFGFGAKNFVLQLLQTDLNFAPWAAQPVHNIFFLLANENGILFGIALATVFFLACKHPRTSAIFAALLPFAFFDHFLVTLHAGQVVLALGLGFFLLWRESAGRRIEVTA